MKAVANSILATLLISIFILTFTNFILLFPWYLTLVYETMNLSTDVATTNGITQSMVDNVVNDLKDKPLFPRNDPELTNVKIFISDVNNAEVEYDVRDDLFSDKEIKYRRQRGEKIKIGIEAIFPFDIKVFGQPFHRDIPIRFNLSTTGTRYYKDLEEYTYTPEDGE